MSNQYQVGTFQSSFKVHTPNFIPNWVSTENSLQKAFGNKPEELVSTLTMLFGAWKNITPLLTMTEGQKNGRVAQSSIKGTEYKYPVIAKRKTTMTVVSSTYIALDKPGLGNDFIYVVMSERWAAKGNTIITPDRTMLRVMEEASPQGQYWVYTLKLKSPSATAFVQLSQFIAGTKWGVYQASTASESLSMGNWSPVQAPGHRRNNISVLRKSINFGGNICNRVVEFKLMNSKGQTTQLWCDWEEYQFLIAWREAKELHLWTSTYSKDEFGRNPLIDSDTGQPIPEGAGLFQQIPNRDFYSVLTERRIRSIISDTFRGTSDYGPVEVVLFTGKGGMELFDEAMKGSSLFTQIANGDVGSKFIRGSEDNLQFGGYFRSYLHVGGQIITVKPLPMLDEGPYADSSYNHPTRSGKLSSYEFYFVDMSTYDGVPNVRYVYQEGRMEIKGLEQGMTLIKGQDYGDYKGNDLFRAPSVVVSSGKDMTSMHLLATCGIQVLRDTHLFALLPDINGI